MAFFIAIAAFCISIYFIIYINSNEYINKVSTKKLRELVNRKLLSEEIFNSIKKNIYAKNNNKNELLGEQKVDLQNQEVSKVQNVGIKSVNTNINVQDFETRKKIMAEKSRQNNISVLLYLGVILIILAGVVFATTTWDYLPGVIKAILLFGFSGMLFGSSELAKKKMKVEKTSFALWVLGTIFLPITCICAGYLEVFGNFFSLNSEGRYLFMLFSGILCLPIYIMSAKKYLSKIFTYLAAVNVSLIAYYSFLNISTENHIVIIAMSIYTLLSLIIVTNIVSKDKFIENFTKAIVIINKIILIIMTILVTTNTIVFFITNNIIYNANTHYIELLGYMVLSYILLIANYKYICIKKKNYSFSIISAITSISFFYTLYAYLVENNYITDIKSSTFIFIILAFFVLIFEFIKENIDTNKKREGLKTLLEVINFIFLPFITIQSVFTILDISNKSYEVILFGVVTLMLLIIKRLSYKKIQTNVRDILDIVICIFSILIPFAMYRFSSQNMEINLILYMSVLFFIPWIISKIINIITKTNENNIYKIVGTMILILPFIFSFIEVDKNIAGIKLLLSVILVFVSIISYVDFIKNNKISSGLNTVILNLLGITILAPVYIILTTWLNIIPLYFMPLITGFIVYLLIFLDNKKRLLNKLKYFIFTMIIYSNFLMFMDIQGITEYIFMQVAILLIYCNTLFRKSFLYNMYLISALVLNTMSINQFKIEFGDIINLFNVIIFLILVGINIYNYNQLKLNKDSKQKNINLKKLTLSFGILMALVPYSQITTYVFELLNVSTFVNMLFIQIPIIFCVFAIEKLIYKSKNVFTYIVQAIIYWQAFILIYEFNYILIYSIILLVLILIGSAIRNKSMFMAPAIALILFVLKGTREFWLSVPWWLYLLVGGVILVYVAMKREANKQKNIENKSKSKLKEFLSKFED